MNEEPYTVPRGTVLYYLICKTMALFKFMPDGEFICKHVELRVHPDDWVALWRQTQEYAEKRGTTPPLPGFLMVLGLPVLRDPSAERIL